MDRNINWTVLEPRNEKGEAAGFGVWGPHVFHITPLQSGNWFATHTFEGVVTQVTQKHGVPSGHLAWRMARDHLTKIQDGDAA
jgi:hypothetical protein